MPLGFPLPCAPPLVANARPPRRPPLRPWLPLPRAPPPVAIALLPRQPPLRPWFPLTRAPPLHRDALPQGRLPACLALSRFRFGERFATQPHSPLASWPASLGES